MACCLVLALRNRNSYRLVILDKTVIVVGAWVAHLVERPTLDFSSGHDLRVVGSSPALVSPLTVQSLLGILSAPPLLVLSL